MLCRVIPIPSDDQILNKIAVFISHLSSPLKKSLLLALTIFGRQNKRFIRVPECKLEMIQNVIEKSL